MLRGALHLDARHSACFANALRTRQGARPGAACRLVSTTPCALASRPNGAAAASANVKIDILGIKLELTPAIKEYTLNKVGHALSHFSNGNHTAVVRLSARSRTAQHGRAEVTLTAGAPHTGKVIRAEAEEETLYAAIDRAADVVSRQLRKLKERDTKGGVHTHHKVPHTLADALLPEVDEAMDAEEREALQMPEVVVRAKEFDAKLMSAAEAVDRMYDSGHLEFFAYRDATSGKIQILYRRKRGGFGVLIPK